MAAIEKTEKEANYYPEMLADLADQIAVKLVDVNLPPEKAADIGFDIAEFMREHWGGYPFYFPKGVQYDFHKRDLDIFERFKGYNHAELAREFNLSVMRIYQIIKAVRTELVKKRQGALF